MLSIEEYKARWAETGDSHRYLAFYTTAGGFHGVLEDVYAEDADYLFANDKEVWFVDELDYIGYHECRYSELWDGIPFNFVDTPSNIDLAMPDGLYAVVWYTYERGDLKPRCDWNISKENILHHIRNQRYVEGANYYLMPDLKEESK